VKDLTARLPCELVLLELKSSGEQMFIVVELFERVHKVRREEVRSATPIMD